MKENVIETVIRTKRAFNLLSGLNIKTKNCTLNHMTAVLDSYKKVVLAANQKDVAYAENMIYLREIPKSPLQRLKLSDGKVNTTINGIEYTVNQAQSITEFYKGLNLYQVSCPIGLIGVIFKSIDCNKIKNYK